MHTSSIRGFLHSFFILKRVDFYSSNQDIINDFQKKPGLIHISKNRGVDVSQVYDIIKTHNMNVLNANIIKLMEFK
jgi:hypothetical protein